LTFGARWQRAVGGGKIGGWRARGKRAREDMSLLKLENPSKYSIISCDR